MAFMVDLFTNLLWEYSYGNIIYIYIIYLLGGLEHEWTMTFHSVGNFMIPIDELFIFFRG